MIFFSLKMNIPGNSYRDAVGHEYSGRGSVLRNEMNSKRLNRSSPAVVKGLPGRTDTGQPLHDLCQCNAVLKKSISSFLVKVPEADFTDDSLNELVLLDKQPVRKDIHPTHTSSSSSIPTCPFDVGP